MWKCSTILLLISLTSAVMVVSSGRMVSRYVAIRYGGIPQKAPAAAPRHQLPSPRNSERNRRIINGKTVYSHEFPYRVGLHIPDAYDPLKFHICGGSLISPHHVLTAAHCLYGVSKGNMNQTTVYINSLDLDPVEYDVVIRGITGYVVHEEYRPDHEIPDIAIVTLDKEVQGVPLAKLPPENAPNYEGQTATVMGWGRTASNTRSKTLLKTSMTIISNKECTKRTEIPTFSSDLCTVSPLTPLEGELGNGSCDGDSGGPIIVNEVQVGIVTSHPLMQYHCGHRKNVEVNIRLSSYARWIKEKIAVKRDIPSRQTN